MSAPTTANRIVRFTASRDQECASPWPCDGVTAGTRCGYVSGLNAGPRPVCGACCDRVDAGEIGDPPTPEPLCTCVRRGGFTRRDDGVFVCAECRHPAALPDSTPAMHRTVDVVEAAQPDAVVDAPEVGDVARVTRVTVLENEPAPATPAPAAAPLTLVHRGRGDWSVAHEPTGTAVVIRLRNRRDAAAALDRLAALPIRWDTVTTTYPATGEGRLALPERTATVITDPESRRLIHAEQARILDGAAPAEPAEPAVACDLDPMPAPTDTTDTTDTADTPPDETAADTPPIVEPAPVEVERPGPTPEPATPAVEDREPITPQQRGRDEVEAWVRGDQEPTEQQRIEQATAAARTLRAEQAVTAGAVTALTAAGLITPYQAAAVATPDGDPTAAPVEPAPLPDLTPYMVDAVEWGADPGTTGDELLAAVRRGILAGDVRGRQVEIGPSEIGHECARWIAYRLAGVDPSGTEPVPWRQRVGTLVHNDIDDHLHRDNVRLEDAGLAPRWLTSIRVEVGDLYPGRPITGTLDVLDIRTAAVLDAKVPGSTAMKTYRDGQPERPAYRAQVQLYGRGVLRAGFVPAWVGTIRLSPARELHQAIRKVERFDVGVADAALARAGGIARMVDQLGARAAALTPPTEATCARCPWLRPGTHDLSIGCPGAPGADLSRAAGRASVDDLVG